MSTAYRSATLNAPSPLAVDPLDGTNWYAVHTKPGAEARVTMNLATLHLEVLNPQTTSGEARRRIVSLFPQYVFARFDVNALRAVRFTRGVTEVVSVAGAPATIDDGIIAAIQKRIGADGLVTLDPDVHEGDHVRVASGPFRDFEGVFKRTMKSGQRVMVLLGLLHSSMQVLVPRAALRRTRP